MLSSASSRSRRAPAWLRGAVLLAALVLTLSSAAGCARVHDQLTGATLDTTTTLSPDADPLQVADWSVTGQLVSVIVRNTRQHTLETAQVTLVGLDAAGTEVGAWTGSSAQTTGDCCQVSGLAPGEQFGLSFAVGSQAAQIASIRLDYRDIGWSADAVPPSPVTAALRSPGLASGNTVVLATISNRGSLAPTVLVQAVLRGRSGRLFAVASTRSSCLPAGGERDLQLTLFQPVPVGVHVASLVARPVEDGARPDCAPTAA